MSNFPESIDDIISLAGRLSAYEKVRLIEKLALSLEKEIAPEEV